MSKTITTVGDLRRLLETYPDHFEIRIRIPDARQMCDVKSEIQSSALESFERSPPGYAGSLSRKSIMPDHKKVPWIWTKQVVLHLKRQ